MVVPVTLAGQSYLIAELPSRANREFIVHLKTEIRKRLDHLGSLDTIDDVMDAIADAGDLWVDLLYAYDKAGAEAWKEVRESEAVLPDRKWLEDNSTATEQYRAIHKVVTAVFPTMPDLVRLVPEFVPMVMESVTRGVAAAVLALSLRSTSSSPPSTDGSPTRSNGASPTPSSSHSSTPRSNAKRSKPKRN